MNNLSFYWLWPCSHVVTEPVAKSVWTARGQHGHIEERNPSWSSCRHARRHRSGKADLESSADIICGLICNRLNRINRLQTSPNIQLWSLWSTFLLVNLVCLEVGILLCNAHEALAGGQENFWGWTAVTALQGDLFLGRRVAHEYQESWIFMNVFKTCSIQDPKHVSY